MLPSHKIQIGGIDDVIIPAKQHLILPGSGRSYTESVINPVEFNGVSLDTPNILNKDLNKAEEILYQAVKEGLINKNNHRPNKLLVTNIKDPQFLANSYGWLDNSADIIRAKNGVKLKSNKRWKPRQ